MLENLRLAYPKLCATRAPFGEIDPFGMAMYSMLLRLWKQAPWLPAPYTIRVISSFARPCVQLLALRSPSAIQAYQVISYA